MQKFLPALTMAFLFVACGDDGSSADSSPQSVQTIYDLGKCTDSRKGESIFVVEDDEEYLCYSGKWVPESKLDASDDEDSPETSSSAKKVSSSSKKSSSEKISSSEKMSSSGKNASSAKEISSSSEKDELKSCSSTDKESSSGKSSSSETPKSSSVESSSSETPESSSDKSSSSKKKNEDIFVDSRDNQTYKVVRIGTQTWFAQNLNYGGVKGYCPVGNPENCEKYGKLYEFDDAVKACPPGWHLPTLDEFRQLVDYVGKRSAVMLMADTGWTERDDILPHVGIDKFGFAVLPAGTKLTGGYDTVGYAAYIWTATDTAGSAYGASFFQNFAEVMIGTYGLENGWAMSVRCLEGDANPASSSSAGSPILPRRLAPETQRTERDSSFRNSPSFATGTLKSSSRYRASPSGVSDALQK